ncbi:MAG: VOC family protein [Bryobacterales bacterium]|nr:VOC family protein [Bryobacterales bacterium]MBV9397445.1 VOC family protein [Bryobacterales bacterium]
MKWEEGWAAYCAKIDRMQASTFDGVEHVAIASPRPPALAQWYVDHLAFKLIYEYSGNYFIKAPNGAVLEIIPSNGDRVASKMYDPGLRHVAITVKDFDAAYSSLLSGNVQFLGEPYSTPQGHRLVFFSDCEGNILHLIQRANPLPE